MRREVYGMNSYEKDITIFGTVHNMKDYFILVFQAIKAGYEFIGYIEY